MSLKKFLFFSLLLSSISSASVFDYRIYYGNTTGNTKDSQFAYSANIYSYLYDTDFSLGAQLNYSPINNINKIKVAALSLAAGYDLSNISRVEVGGGKSVEAKSGKFYTGFHGYATFLIQSNFDSFLEALQFGGTIKYDKFNSKKIKDEKAILLFIGLGF